MRVYSDEGTNDDGRGLAFWWVRCNVDAEKVLFQTSRLP